VTCVIGMVREGKVWLAGDSAASDGTAQITSIMERKVFLWGAMAVGFAGAFRGAQVLRYALKPMNAAPEAPMGWLVRTFIPRLKTAFERHEVVGEDLIPDLLVGIGGRLFEVSSDLEVIESRDGVAAIGSGAPYALGALAAIGRSNRPDTALACALSIAERYCPGVKGPFLQVRT
jgi:ATP-dependent protease HslVU (ClpYQ) peptidase subunit